MQVIRAAAKRRFRPVPRKVHTEKKPGIQPGADSSGYTNLGTALEQNQSYCIPHHTVIVRRLAAFASRRDDLCISLRTPQSPEEQNTWTLTSRRTTRRFSG